MLLASIIVVIELVVEFGRRSRDGAIYAAQTAAVIGLSLNYKFNDSGGFVC
jgi:hypothetical protein